MGEPYCDQCHDSGLYGPEGKEQLCNCSCGDYLRERIQEILPWDQRTNHPDEPLPTGLPERNLDGIKCPECGQPASAHGDFQFCSMTYGRRGWRQLGVYDG